MARTMTSQCIYHLAISPSHTLKQMNNIQPVQTVFAQSKLAHTAKPVLGKGK